MLALFKCICTEASSSITFEELLLGIVVVVDDDGNDIKYNDNNYRHSNDENFTVVYDDEYPGMSAGFLPVHILVEIFHPEVAAANVATTDRSTSSSSSFASPLSLLLQPLPHRDTGIIGTRGPHVMFGYWNRSGYDNISSNSCKNATMTITTTTVVVVVGCSPMILGTSTLRMESCTFAAVPMMSFAPAVNWYWPRMLNVLSLITLLLLLLLLLPGITTIMPLSNVP